MADGGFFLPTLPTRQQARLEEMNVAKSIPNSENTDSAFGKGSQDISSEEECPSISNKTSDGPYVSPLDPSYVSPIDPSYVSPIDPSYVSPIDPTYLSPLDPSYVSPIDPSYVSPIEEVDNADEPTRDSVRDNCGTATKPKWGMTSQELYNSKITYSIADKDNCLWMNDETHSNEDTILVSKSGLLAFSLSLSLNSDGKIRNTSTGAVYGVTLDSTSKECKIEEISPVYEETPINEATDPLIVLTEPGQFWEKRTSKIRGYFTLRNPTSGKYLATNSSNMLELQECEWITFDLEGIDLSTECEALIGDKKLLLKHPLIETFLDAEWMTIRPYYILNLIIYLIWLCFFTFLIQNHLDWSSQKKNIFIFKHAVPEDYYHIIFICGYVVTILMVFYLTFRELTQFLTLKRLRYYIQLENLFDWAVIITTLIYLITIWEDPNLALNVGVYAMLLGWVNLTFYISEFPMFGTIVHAIFNVTLSLLPVFVIVLPILCGFMFFFNFTLASDQGAVNDIGKTFLKTIAMMLGNIEISEFNSKTNSTTDFNLAMASNEVGIFGFMIFICVIVMNVMIGLTVNRINEFIEQAHLIRLKKTWNAYQGFDKLNKFMPCCWRNNKTSWERVEVSLHPKTSYFNSIFSSLLRAQGFLKNDVKYLEHNATVFSISKGSKLKAVPLKDIGIPSWLLKDALEICEKREELAKKNQDETDNKIFQLKTQEAQEKQMKTTVEYHKEQKNRTDYYAEHPHPQQIFTIDETKRGTVIARVMESLKPSAEQKRSKSQPGNRN